MNLLQRLTAATTDAERAAVMLEMSLSALAPAVQNALTAAAVPHWFDALFLEALLAAESDDLYDQLLQQSFVELVPGKGYAVHERTRISLLDKLWREEPERFMMFSDRAADYCESRAKQTDAAAWQAEEIYHRLVSDPEAGIAGLRGLATKWANYEYHTFEEIEYTIRLAEEQISAGRLSGTGADWTRLWQAKLALIFGKPERAAKPLSQIQSAPDSDLLLAAEVAQTRGDRLAQSGDKVGMESAWRSAYTLYHQLPDGKGQLDAYLLAAKMRQEGLPNPAPDPIRSTPLTSTPSRNALQLIDNIHAAWIKGVLSTSIDNNINLELARDAGQAANLLFHSPQGADRPVASGQRLAGLFAAADRSLLILGAPGSGKTITLLQLLDELLDQARTDSTAPIPLLFNLSSFGSYAQANNTDLTSWLVEQAYQQYRLSRPTTREQLALGTEFVLLLDGLDEVPVEERETCVTAVNQFMQATPTGLVVCSRIGDYQALQKRLAVAHALVLQPLTNKQITAFIDQFAEPQRTMMLQQIAADWQLREALRSPLLLNLYPQALPGLFTMPDAAAATYADSVEARRQSLFAAYVSTVFVQPESAVSAQAKSANQDAANFQKKSKRWLAFLGSRMQQAGTTLFFVEELQPTWLPQRLFRQYRGIYGLFIGVIVGLIGGILIGLIGNEIETAISTQLGGPSEREFIRLIKELNIGLTGLLLGVLISIAGAFSTSLTTSLKWPWLRAGIGALITWIIVGLLGSMSAGLKYWVSLGFVGGFVFGPGLIVSIGNACLVFNIQLRERVKVLRPSRQRILQFIKKGVFYGLIGGLIGGFVGGLSAGRSTGFDIELIDGISGGLLIGVMIGFLGGLLGGLIFAFLDTPHVDERPDPGRGVRTSLGNALLMILISLILLGLPAWLIGQRFGVRTLVFAIVLANVLPIAFSWFGGLAWCQHWALRIVLARQDWLPWRLLSWLDDMVSRGLLRRVGGGYIFIHRSLLEYFAALEEGNV